MVSIGQIAVVIVVGIFVLYCALYALSLALVVPAVWRGDKESVSLYSSNYDSSISVNVRNYPTVALSLVCICIVGPIWLGLGSIGLVSGITSLPFAIMVILGFILLPVAVIVNAFNRPKFLVPPPHREKSGWVFGDEEKQGFGENNSKQEKEVDGTVAPTNEQSTGDNEAAHNDDTTFVYLTDNSNLNDVLADVEQTGEEVLVKKHYDDGSYVAVVEDADGSQTVYTPNG